MSDDEIRQEIRRKAAARAEATVYSLQNPYLSPRQKAMVESVYQFPLAVFTYSFGFVTLGENQSFVAGYIGATLVSAAAWLAARTLPGRWFSPLGLLFAGTASTLIGLVLTGLALWNHRWAVGAFLALSSIGVAAIVEIPMWLWTITAGRLHAKYGIAKRMFGIVFRFESELD